jgi:hypothetical protein
MEDVMNTLKTFLRFGIVLLLTRILLTGCFYNENVESPGNEQIQDSGMHKSIEGNFLLTKDGTRIATILTGSDKKRFLYIINVPEGSFMKGPDLTSWESVEMMMTPDTSREYLIEWDLNGRIKKIQEINLVNGQPGSTLPIDAYKFNSSNLSNDGKWLVLADAGTGGDPTEPFVIIDTATKNRTEIKPEDTARYIYDVRFTKTSDAVLMVYKKAGKENEKHVFLKIIDIKDNSIETENTRTVEIKDFDLNILGYLTWSIRISPDGKWAAISGYSCEKNENSSSENEDVQIKSTTVLIDITEAKIAGMAGCQGPGGFTPDSGTFVCYRYVRDEKNEIDKTELVFIDLPEITETAAEYDGLWPVFYITPKGDMVITYNLLTGVEQKANDLVITSIATGETAVTKGPDVQLNEFVVTNDGNFVYLVYHGAFYMLDIYNASVTMIYDEKYEADNINILPDGTDIILSKNNTAAFDFFTISKKSITKKIMIQ